MEMLTYQVRIQGNVIKAEKVGCSSIYIPIEDGDVAAAIKELTKRLKF